MSTLYNEYGVGDAAAGTAPRAGTVLRSSAQWRTWFSQIRESAITNDVWEYIEPDNPYTTPIPTKPREPGPGEVQEGATQARELTAANDDKLQRLLKHFDRELAKYGVIQRGLNRITNLIRGTLASEHQHYTVDSPHLKQLLLSLRERFSPAEKERMIEVRLQWNAHARTSMKDSNLDAWLTRWDGLYTEAVSAGVPEAKDIHCASYDFLSAIRQVDETFYQIWYGKVFHTSESVHFKSVVNAFRQQRATTQRKKPIRPTIGMATLDGQPEANQTTNPKGSQKKQEKRAPICVCEQRHYYAACPYLVQSARPAGWKPDTAVQRKVDKNVQEAPTNRREKLDPLLKTLREETSSAHFVNAQAPPVAFFTTGPIARQEPSQDRPGSYAYFTGDDTPLRDQWILDSGANQHISNNRNLFKAFTSQEGSVSVGDTKTAFEGYGDIDVSSVHPETGESVPITIHNVRYAPGFHVNLISLSVLEDLGFSWGTKDKAIINKDGNKVAQAHIKAGLYILSFDHAPETAVFATRTSSKPVSSKATTERWHRRLGHMHDQRIEKLAQYADGIEITKPTEGTAADDPELCAVCQLTKAYRQISRRVQGPSFGSLGRVHFDLMRIKEGFNGDHWITHFYLDGIRFHWLQTHDSKNGCQHAVVAFMSQLRNWFDLPIRAFHYDNERSAGRTVEAYLEEQGVIVEHSVVGTPETNSFAERSGGVIIMRARALIEDAKLPKDLWPEAVQTAVYIINRSPTKLNDGRWIIPHQEFHRQGTGIHIPINLSNLRVYGCRAYVRIQDIPRSEKMQPRAEIGYLVGYKTTNVWRIWFPRRNHVRLVRDAVFDENLGFKDEGIQREPVHLPEPNPLIVEEEEVDGEIEQAIQRLGAESVIQNQPISEQENQQETLPQNKHSEASEPIQNQPPETAKLASPEPYQTYTPETTPSAAQQSPPPPPVQPTSPSTPDREITISTPTAPERAHSMPPDPSSAIKPIPITLAQPSPQPVQEPPAIQSTPRASSIPGGFPDESPAPESRTQAPLAPRDINGNVTADNIVSGQRKRRTPADPYLASYVTYNDDAENQDNVLAAFATGISAPRPENCRHRDDLPPEPKNWKEMMNHPFRDGFLSACGLEIKNLDGKGTYSTISRPQDRSVQILPLTWVFTYKFNSNGFLQKLKARICVRGDLQAINSEDKRAATLAARTARSIFALVAAFDLGTMQFDAVNAFLNSELDETVYTRLPEGFEDGQSVWRLRKALYGLRKSPRLWQQEASRVLHKLGLTMVPEDPCLFVRGGIIIFFYVDDIIIVYHRSKHQEAIQLRHQLERHWELRDMGEASWFLGIRILRDQQRHKLWLCQDSYISAMAARYHLTGGRRITTPLPVERLQIYTGQATPSQIHGYQQKVGSVLYATIITRPDAAKAASHLAEFLTNPGPQHLDAVDRLIRYLYHTRFHAIEYRPTEGENALLFFSDASYGDHADRKSSEGYLCKLFGAAVDWKASKQRTVTTSTTEAELLALSEAAKSAIWWKRLLRTIHLEYQDDITIHCDNRQTVDLLTKDTPQLRTKLRHVDIHQHWLRQEVQAGTIRTNWVPTTGMAADGLTKLLPSQSHARFMQMLGLTDIQHLLAE